MSGKETVAVRFETGGQIAIDLGGAHDGACCGCASSSLNERLIQLGVKLKVERVGCRLSPEDRAKAQHEKKCSMPVNVRHDTELAKERIFNE